MFFRILIKYILGYINIKIEGYFVEKFINKCINENIYEIMLQIGKKRGCIVSGGNVDDEKTAKIILDEFKNGKLGKITIEGVR